MRDKNIRRTQVIAVLLMIVMISAAGTLSAKDLDFRGMLRSYTGVDLDTGGIPVNEQTLDFKLKGWGDRTQITVNPYAYAGIESQPEMGLREAYVDIFFDEVDLRIGKQAVVWGKAEGAFITDIVSPQDMRSFILADFTEIRKGIPAVKADWYTGPYTIEGVWIPQFVPSTPPSADSMWAQPMPSGFGAASIDADTTFHSVVPEASLENSEAFVKISYFGSAFNAEIMGGYAWDDLPSIADADIDMGDMTVDTVTREHFRHGVLGGSVSTTISSVVLRSEAAVYLDKAFTTLTPSGPDIERHHEVHALAGADWSLFDVALSAQYIVQYVTDYNDSLACADELSHTATFRAQHSLFSDDLTVSLFGYVGFDPYDALLRPSFSYTIEDAVELEGGVELFVGDSSGTFGAYTDNSLAYLSLRWYF
jgi:hypothetical protein